MKVRVKEEGTTLAGEMSPFDEPEVGYIAEMASDPAKLADFGFSEEVVGRAKALADANTDQSPEFPVLRVEAGWSGSGRLWDGKVLDSIAEQTNSLQPVGHLGHIPDVDADSSMPDPQTTWIGAFTKTEKSTQKGMAGEMVKVIYITGYNLPGAKVRTFIRSKAVRGISWWGRARQVPIPGKGVKIEDFTLLALDWARKLSEGMPSSRVVAMAKEMREDKLDKDLSAVTPDEFEKENPNAYSLIVAKVGAEKDTTIGEMQTKLDTAEGDKTLLQEIREILKLNDDESPKDKIASLMKRLGDKAKASVEEALDKVLGEKVQDEATRKLVKRLMPVAEMETKAADVTDVEAVEKIVGEMVTESFDKDDVVQQLVSEQEPPIVRRRSELGSEGAKGIDKALEAQGMTRERVKMGA